MGRVNALQAATIRHRINRCATMDPIVISTKVVDILSYTVRKKMLAAATLSLLLLLGAHEAAAKTPKNVTATGGGIVMPGDDLVLTYHVGAAWDRCYWFWYVR